ncbi:non-muscle cofilin 1-like [Paramisgurnus dabryanus]|uniref:non-muscle cofilin 1-like n=1 Tax=Paramisgurnus dabryanus TaxID=90735 RepID=UPI0031F3CAB7
MASGVLINDEVVIHYNQIKVRRQGEEEKERLKLLMMRVSEDLKEIIVDHDNCLRKKDFENVPDVLQLITSKLPPKECRYCLYDCTYESKGSLKEDLVFIMWSPDDSSLKKKMVYAASKADLRKKLPGVKFEWQVNDNADKQASCLVEKLGGRAAVTTLEGMPV